MLKVRNGNYYQQKLQNNYFQPKVLLLAQPLSPVLLPSTILVITLLVSACRHLWTNSCCENAQNSLQRNPDYGVVQWSENACVNDGKDRPGLACNVVDTCKNLMLTQFVNSESLTTELNLMKLKSSHRCMKWNYQWNYGFKDWNWNSWNWSQLRLTLSSDDVIIWAFRMNWHCKIVRPLISHKLFRAKTVRPVYLEIISSQCQTYHYYAFLSVFTQSEI